MRRREHQETSCMNSFSKLICPPIANSFVPLCFFPDSTLILPSPNSLLSLMLTARPRPHGRVALSCASKGAGVIGDRGREGEGGCHRTVQIIPIKCTNQPFKLIPQLLHSTSTPRLPAVTRIDYTGTLAKRRAQVITSNQGFQT